MKLNLLYKVDPFNTDNYVIFLLVVLQIISNHFPVLHFHPLVLLVLHSQSCICSRPIGRLDKEEGQRASGLSVERTRDECDSRRILLNGMSAYAPPVNEVGLSVWHSTGRPWRTSLFNTLILTVDSGCVLLFMLCKLRLCRYSLRYNVIYCAINVFR